MDRNQYITKQLDRMTTTMKVRGLSPLTEPRYSRCARDPWEALLAHKPLGEVMRARKVAYGGSQKSRGAG